MHYTGIGSRSTPKEVQHKMHRIAQFLSSRNFILRSGGADGADSAFELGALSKEIYLPWENFNKNESLLFPPKKEAYILAEKYHPKWDYLRDSVKALMARNMHQVLGWELNAPSKFTVCYTADGGDSGGTGQALRLCRDLKIPVFNLYHEKSVEELSAFVQTLRQI